ncbi:MAG: T9SS type A sorting domain-containing protein [Sphingobacteriales bacterium]|nr:MAG: T9SS type A sorting domain-containing protein [Sphingobacteriales bacterium]
MKQLFTLLLLLCITGITWATPIPLLQQSKYRWRNNNGNEATATWKAAENTAITLTSMTETIRFRGEYYCTGAGSSVGHYLSYSKNGGTTWTEINESATNDFMLVTTKEVAHGTTTTNQLGNSTGGTFDGGKVIAQNAPGMALSLAASARTEMEWVIKPTATVQNNTTYLFENRSISLTGIQGQLTTNFSCATPAVTAASSFRRCGPGTLSLTASATPSSSTITWWTAATGGTNIGTGATITSPSYTANTTVFVQAQNGSCVSARTPVALIIEEMPVAIDITDGSHCINEAALELTSVPAYPNTYTYLWSTGAATASVQAGLSYGAPVTYWVQVTSPNGCVKRDTVEVILNPVPEVALGNDTTVCDNTLLTLDAGNEGGTYLWNTGATSQSIGVSPGTFSVAVTNEYNCSATDEITIDAFEPATVTGFTFVPRFDVEAGRIDFAPLNPVAIETYHWDFGNGNTSDQMYATHTYGNSGAYEVSLTVANDCGSMDTTLMINVDHFTGIVSVVDPVVLNVYPVPAQNSFTIESPAADVQIRGISIVNLSGQELIHISGLNKQHFVQDISRLAAGHYLVRIQTSKGDRVKKISIVK